MKSRDDGDNGERLGASIQNEKNRHISIIGKKSWVRAYMGSVKVQN